MITGKRMAILGAARSTHPRWRVGAALISGSKIIVCSNAKKTAPFTRDNYWPGSGIHAEAALFARAEPGDFQGAKLYVYRRRRDGKPGLAKPCAACQKIIDAHGIKQVIYSTPEGWETE